jgi:hypothetical protein
MVTLGEAAGENLHFTASAIAEPKPMARFAPLLCERPAAHDEIGVSDTQNVIAIPTMVTMQSTKAD